MSLIYKFRKEILLFLGLSALYFFLRLIFLERLPIFTDEAIYVRWAQIALNDPSWRFISLTDGKQPLFIWFAMVFMKFIEDPLLAGRLVSVFCGFFTMIGLFLLSFELFKSKKISFLTALFYVAFPLAQVHDRMALYDSMVSLFFVWSLYFSILLVRKIRLDIAYTLGIILGAGVLTKSSNFFSIYLLPFVLLFFNYKQKFAKKLFIKLIILLSFSTAIAYILYNSQRLSPLFHMIEQKNSTFVYPLSEWINHPFTFFMGNLRGLSIWLFEYLTIPFVVLIFVSLFFIKKFTKEKTLLFIFFALPFLALALFGKVIFPRFIFFMSVMLLPIAVLGLVQLQDLIEKKIKLKISKFYLTIILAFVFIAYPFFVSFTFASNPMSAKISRADSNQYVNSWAAGWGVNESIEFFENEAKKGEVFIATEGTFGLMPAALEMYLVDNPNIKIKAFWPVDKFPREAVLLSKNKLSYFVFYQKENLEIPSDYPLELVFAVKQGNTDFYFRVYKILSEPN